MNMKNLGFFQFYEAGFKEPTPIQARSWPIALQGRDIIAIAKTGSGKKLGFFIPGFILLKRLQNDPWRGPTVLVMCPTEDIAIQVQGEAVKFGAPAGVKINVCICICKTFVIFIILPIQ
jgi:ATP-dependent RNA helicase DDX5/DBP2